jgi:hypothetical protein
MRKIILITIALILVCTPAAWSNPPDESINLANQAYYDGDYAGALLLLQDALQGVWNKAPLAVRNVNFVDQPPEGPGQYHPRQDNIFESIDPILLYFEPVGYTVLKQGEQYKYALSSDFAVLDNEGNELGRQKDVGRSEATSRMFNMELMMLLTINLKGLPSGKYKLVVTLKDLNSEKTTTFEMPFGIR